MKLKLLFALLLIFFSGVAFADGNCPDGMHPIGDQSAQGCAPNANSQSNNGPIKPREVWETRWGAIAIGSTAGGGGVGISKDMVSKRKAEKAAISQCLSTGGGAECKKNVLRYNNQCAVIAWGDTAYITQGAETIAIASSVALEKCSNKTTNCKIFYADCSLAERVR